MHEVAIARDILDLAEETARREGARVIRTVALRVGAMSGVVPEALTFAFEVAKAGTLAADASLKVEWVPLACYCRACNLEFEVDDPHGIALCPRCRQPSAEVRRGRELAVRYLEVV